MCGIMKTLVRVAVVGTVAGGGLVLLASTPRGRALLQQAHASVTRSIDQAIDDPIALRVKIEQLESEYPKRIAAVSKDLAEVESQVAQVRRELAISERVVELAEADLNNLDHLLTKAEEHRRAKGYGIVQIRYQDKVMSEREASGSARQIQQMRDAYAQRAEDLRQELGFLSEQQTRLQDLLAQLEAEHAEFQAQLWQIDRKVDAAARNERLIALMKKRQSRIDEHSRYAAISLDDLNRQLDSIRTRQESELARLAGTSTELTYKSIAERELERAKRRGRGDFRVAPEAIELEADVIELEPEDEGSPLARRGG